MRNVVKFVTPEEYEHILQTANGDRFSTWLPAVLKTLWATGCRPAEIVGSKFSPGREPEEGGTRISRRKAHHGLRGMDVLPNFRLHVEGKHTSPAGRTLDLKPRIVLCAEKETWTELRKAADAASSHNENLFLPRSRNGVGALDAQIRKLQPTLSARLRGFSPRWLRHSHAINAIRSGVDLVSIQKQLGHEDMTTTATYLRHAGIDEARYLTAFGGDDKTSSEARDCPSCGFAWNVDTRTGALDLSSRMGQSLRRRR